MGNTSYPLITDCSDLRGKRVLVRASLNVPTEEGRVLNYFRVMRAMPTLLHLTHAGAKVILIAHIGRDPENTLKPIYSVIKEHVPATFVEKTTGKEVEDAIESLEDGSLLMLENVRSEPGERENDPELAKTLASYGDIFVQDAFPVAHRAHASVVGIPQYLPSYFGLTFTEEYRQLMKALDPLAPSLLIIGGAKFETKQPLVEKFIKRYDNVFVTGALANDFFKARGLEVGTSLVSESALEDSELLHHEKLLLPVDVTVSAGSSIRVTTPDAVEKGEKILDAGPATIAMLSKYIHSATTILWNGPLGDYEHGFGEQTKACAEVVAKSKAYSIVGGGDTIAAIESLALNDQFGFISTAGGAMLHLLEHGTVPAFDAVIESHQKRA